MKKQIIAAILVFGFCGGAYAGALTELKASASPDAVNMPFTEIVPQKVSTAQNVQAVSYLTQVQQEAIARILRDFYDDGVTVVNIALSSVLKLPANPIVSQYYDANGYTVMVSGTIAEMPGTGWATISEYKAVQSELPMAISFIMRNEKLGRGLIEITKVNGSFTIKVKANPW
jgi:hypothetical protein